MNGAPRSTTLRTVLLLLAGVTLGALAVWTLVRRTSAPSLPPTPLVVERMREVARLETLDLAV